MFAVDMNEHHIAIFHKIGEHQDVATPFICGMSRSRAGSSVHKLPNIFADKGS